jgi:hypothetical protein
MKINTSIKGLIATLIITASVAPSCTKLDETVYDSIIAESTKLTAKDVDNIIAPAYTSLRTLYWGWHSYFDTQEECSDVIVTPIRLPRNGWNDGGVYRAMHMHSWDATQSHSTGLWTRTFSGINNANRAIYQLEQISGLENLTVTVAELKALRAFYYYILLDHFRNVPIVEKFDVPVGFLPEQNSAQEVYAFIEKELRAVIPLLSEENSNVTYGRMNKWAAKMVLAKLYLNAEVYTGTPKWAEALKEAEEIKGSGKFKLAASYREPFVTNNESSVEQIFSIPFDEIYGIEFNYHMKTLHALSRGTYNLQAEPWNGSCAVPQFINTYDKDDKRLPDTWLSGPQFSSTGAPLILGTTNTQLNYTNRLSEMTGSQENEGLRFIKYEIKSGSLARLSNDVPFFRYTDALMIQAECLLRLQRPDEAAAIVTSIRQRDFAAAPAKATVTGADLQKGSSYVYGNYANGAMVTTEGGADITYGRLLDELGWEFAGEHHRRQDLIRFGVFTKKSWFAHKPNGEQRKYFPIPQAQLDVNSKLKQNSGYN